MYKQNYNITSSYKFGAIKLRQAQPQSQPQDEKDVPEFGDADFYGDAPSQRDAREFENSPEDSGSVLGIDHLYQAVAYGIVGAREIYGLWRDEPTREKMAAQNDAIRHRKLNYKPLTL